MAPEKEALRRGGDGTGVNRIVTHVGTMIYS